MDVESKRFERVPLNIIFVDLASVVCTPSVEKVVRHHILEAAKVVKRSDKDQADPAEGAKQTTDLRKEVQKFVNLPVVVNLVLGDFKSHCVVEGLFVLKGAAWPLLYKKAFCVVTLSSIVVIFQFHGSPSVKLDVINSILGIDGVPADFSRFVDATLAEFVLDKAFLVVDCADVLKLHPLLLVLF